MMPTLAGIHHTCLKKIFSQSAQRCEPRTRSPTRFRLGDLGGLGSVPSVKCMGGKWGVNYLRSGYFVLFFFFAALLELVPGWSMSAGTM